MSAEPTYVDEGLSLDEAVAVAEHAWVQARAEMKAAFRAHDDFKAEGAHLSALASEANARQREAHKAWVALLERRALERGEQ